MVKLESEINEATDELNVSEVVLLDAQDEADRNVEGARLKLEDLQGTYQMLSDRHKFLSEYHASLSQPVKDREL